MALSPASQTPDTSRKIGLLTATAIVVANMVGTGVFTSIGFQAAGIPRPIPLLALWIIGGVLAICGAFAYGELGSAFPRSGGEYHYLSRLYHPRVGFLSGWVSATVGFPAPIALAAMAFGQYFHGAFPFMTPKILATLLILLVTSVHLTELRISGRFQNAVTYLEVLLITGFVACGLIITPHPVVFSIMPSAKDLSLLFCPAFAVSLVYVSYAYSGWNGSTYIAGEIKNPSSNVPKSILSGTLIVIILYLLLNFVFLRSTPIDGLAGNLDVGKIAAVNVFGAIGGKVMSIFISLCLISSVSSMVLAGPRILKVMGEDHQGFRFFSKVNSRGIPWPAMLTQSGLALLLLWTGTFEQVLTFTGFTLTLFTSLTVFGVFILRARKDDKNYFYKTTGYPVTPILFLALNLWMLIFLFIKRPGTSIAGLAIVAVGILIYHISKGAQK
jgi:basic amino acid/polyamine antiporter, APA family